MGLGATIRALRDARGWSQNELARRAAVKQPTLQRIESGESKSPAIRNVVQIARALGVTVESLYDEAFADPIADLQRRVSALERREKPDLHS